jgi:hypothetical protein
MAWSLCSSIDVPLCVLKGVQDYISASVCQRKRLYDRGSVCLCSRALLEGFTITDPKHAYFLTFCLSTSPQHTHTLPNHRFSCPRSHSQRSQFPRSSWSHTLRYTLRPMPHRGKERLSVGAGKSGLTAV